MHIAAAGVVVVGIVVGVVVDGDTEAVQVRDRLSSHRRHIADSVVDDGTGKEVGAMYVHIEMMLESGAVDSVVAVRCHHHHHHHGHCREPQLHT